MIAFVPIILVGVLCIAFGIAIRKGNLNLIHEHHRNRVSEEDQLPFAKAVGVAVIALGCAIMLCGGLFIAALLTDTILLAKIGGGILIAGAAVEIAFLVYATTKYNKGLF